MKKIIYFLFPLLASCGENNQNNQMPQDTISKDFLQETVTAKAEMKRLQKEFTLAGKVTVDPERTISYSPLISGVIVKNHFSLGDYVTKGKVMTDIHSAELSSLQSELNIAQRNLKSAEALHRSGLATDRELVEARSIVEKLQSDTSLYGENQGDGIFSIKAPMSGYVIKKYGNPGVPVSEGCEPLFSIADLSTVWVIANVYAGNLQFVHEGQNVEITSVAYPEEVFKGKINFLSQIFDIEDKALKVRITLPNPELKLKPEMSVVVKLLSDSDSKLVTVPNNAVIFDNNNYYVIVGKENFEIRKITPFNHHKGFTYISEGLHSGEEVVIKNQLLIYNEIKGR
jgi:efflux transporter, RND family, MFP subunit